ncbi:MAG: ATP-binding protein [Clostridiales bacterium]|nr:ATP-binding protein [Clostridiales bacterium]
MSTDRITLAVPSRAEYARTVRMTASALVGRADATYDDLDDVRIAAEEVFVYACDHIGTASEVVLVFELGEASVDIQVRLQGSDRVTDEDAERRAAYATFLLQSVTDHYELSSDLDGAYLRVSKRFSQEPRDAEG